MNLSRRLMVSMALFVPGMAAGQSPPRSVPGAPEAQASAPYYAVIKKPLLRQGQHGELTPLFPEPYPVRGVILANLGFAGSGIWTEVDFDTRTIARFLRDYKYTSGERTAVAYGKAERPLSTHEFDKIVREANDIWNPPPGRSFDQRRPAPTDTACAIALFDNAEVIFDYGNSCITDTDRLFGLLSEIKTPEPTR